jgi:hypothetical protein
MALVSPTPTLTRATETRGGNYVSPVTGHALPRVARLKTTVAFRSATRSDRGSKGLRAAMFILKKFRGSLLVLSLAALTPSGTSGAPVNFSCNPVAMKGSVSVLDTTSTTSLTYLNVPESLVSFRQGGASASCVVVRFSAQAAAGTNGSLYIRAYLDDSTTAAPQELIYYNAGEPFFGVRSYDFIFPSVAPGRHSLRMQFRSASGTWVGVYFHTTIVQYVP